MINLTELLALRDSLERLLLSGVRRVQMPDRATEFNSVDEIRKALSDANAAIEGASGTTPPSFTLATHSRD